MKTLTTGALLAIAGVFGLSGCASTGNVTPQYVPPSTYQNYDCQALNQEYIRVNRYVTDASNRQSTLYVGCWGWRVGRTLGHLP